MLLWSCLDNSDVERKKLLSTSNKWNANWIVPTTQNDTVNVWNSYRKTFQINSKVDNAVAKIAVDSKYWLWINGDRVVFEGGLKRGPTPKDSYYDFVDIAKYLKKGENTIAILTWYFGKEGFSHKNSGQPGLFFEVRENNLEIFSDASWKAWQHPAFGQTDGPHPNYRLPESNIRFDAQKGGFDFVEYGYDDSKQPNAKVLKSPPTAPWNELIVRPIPQWKDFGLKSYENKIDLPFISEGDTLKMRLPYNAQVHPYLEVEAEAGQKIDIRTDNYLGGGALNVRSEYITTIGRESYENLGWMNGHKVHYYIPKGIQIIDLKYRETGYDTEFSGSFTCDKDFYNRLWKKSLRTLYVTMRDNYMDCPDRERAQWWGDAVLESGEAFYALSPSSHLLAKKGILELMYWQREDSTIYSPVPAGNWHNELPTQMLSSIGTYGFWNYYWHTGDKETLEKVYDKMGKYLALWKLKDNGTVQIRKGGWTWGDWGENKDMPLLFNTQYYMALDSYARMSELLDRVPTTDSLTAVMAQFKKDFNQIYWNGKAYRSSEYKGKTDDRSQGLAVVAGLADQDKYQAIYKVLQKEKHASPYMEKYVLEALFQMGYPEFALQRMQERFSKMVNHPTITTLWEGWGIGSEGYGGGTINHAWSGGGLTLLSQYVAGIYPTSAGYETFKIKPQLGFLKEINAVVPSIKGNISVKIDVNEGFLMELSVPKNTKAEVYISRTFGKPQLNGKAVTYKESDTHYVLWIIPGNHRINAAGENKK
ncbi:alpha-L-rhamnosidase-related protein [Costertonia aggregata]|uniref:Glycoside hydrolase n=1 Tax=Costertonia aggregata TaxID=343403 RepID=A0A7H9AMY8_9FLAO|nr:alpha-L-rhamnosidase C-terminal domain-containing protein [Costertonia aggregata]QLG44645.1 glycoside hydrolase [Costertonia aggregata]